jgi:hypothetical protein
MVQPMQISPVEFGCPTCVARYKIIKIEADATQWARPLYQGFPDRDVASVVSLAELTATADELIE